LLLDELLLEDVPTVEAPGPVLDESELLPNGLFELLSLHAASAMDTSTKAAKRSRAICRVAMM